MSDSFSREQVLKAYNAAPDAVRAAFSAEATTNVIAGLKDKYQLHVDQSGLVAKEVGYLLLGLVDPNTFMSRLRAGGVPEGSVSGIISDLNEQVFKLLREEMRQASGKQGSAAPAPRQGQPPMPRPQPMQASRPTSAPPVPVSRPTMPPRPQPMQAPRPPAAPAPTPASAIPQHIAPLPPKTVMPRLNVLEAQCESAPAAPMPRPQIPASLRPVAPAVPITPRPVAPPPPNLPGAAPESPVSPPPAPPPQRPPAPPAPPYTADPYREPVE